MRKGNINVYIESQGHALPEYQVEIVDDKTVACYIPSEAGKVLYLARLSRHCIDHLVLSELYDLLAC